MNKSTSELLREYANLIQIKESVDKDIDQNEVKGEDHTGYEDSDNKGPFECRNCTYSDENSTCGQQIMMEYSKKPRAENGRVKIDPHGCCEYVDRKGEK